MVYEEKAEHLYLLSEQLTLTLQMGTNGFTYLYATDLLFVYTAHSISLIERQAVEETDTTLTPVNAFHDEVVVILCQPTALFLQVETLIHKSAYLLDTSRRLHIKTDTGLRVAFADNYFLQIDVAVGGRRTYLPDTFHLYLLYQFLIVGIYGIQPIYHIIYITLTMGGTIQDGEERTEHCNAFTCLVVLDNT